MEIFRVFNSKGSSMVESAIVFPIVIITIVITISLIVSLLYTTKNEISVNNENQKKSHEKSGVATYDKRDSYNDKLYYSDGLDIIKLNQIEETIVKEEERTIKIFNSVEKVKSEYESSGYVVDETEYIRKIDLIVEKGYSELTKSIENIKIMDE